MPARRRSIPTCCTRPLRRARDGQSKNPLLVLGVNKDGRILFVCSDDSGRVTFRRRPSVLTINWKSEVSRWPLLQSIPCQRKEEGKMKPTILLLAISIVAASCISKPQEVSADHLVMETGTIPLKGIHSVRFRTKDGFEVSASGGIGALAVSESRVCGPLNFYRSAPDSALPPWAPSAGPDYQRFLPVECIDRANIASTTMTVRRTDAAASAMCVALLPLCALAHSVPGQ
jgi:hypothetical protein